MLPSAGTIRSRTPLAMLVSLLRGRPRVRRLMLLSTLMGLTEGVGLLLLIPILGALDQSGSTMRRVIDRIGLPDAQVILLVLAVGVGIVTTRAIIGRTLLIEQRGLEQQVVDGMRRRLFAAAGRAEWRWLSAQRNAEHVAIMSTQLNRLGFGIFSASQLFTLIVSVAIHFAVVLLISWQTASVAVAGGILVGLLLLGQRARAARHSQAVGPLARDVHRITQEEMAQVRVNRLLHRQNRAEAELDSAVDRMRIAQLGHVALVGRISAFGQIIIALFGVGLIGFGHGLMGLPIAKLLPLFYAVMRIGPMIGRMQDSWSSWLHAAPAAEAAFDLIDRFDAAAEPEADPEAPPLILTRSLRLDAVSVSHPGRKKAALDGVSLSIAAQTTTAIVGPSGAGKSTLADLLMGMIEPDAGRISVDDQPIVGADRLRWRRSVGYVEQQATLFNGTIRYNLLAATPEATEAELLAALDAASAGFVAALPAGLDTPVGDNGVRLSGGERQRLALARALLGKPELLILDEATSALDAANQAAIADAIAALHGRVTIVTISHGGFMLDRADRIVSVEGGRIVDGALA